jgi:hypothetical protein
MLSEVLETAPQPLFPGALGIERHLVFGLAFWSLVFCTSDLVLSSIVHRLSASNLQAK